MHNTVAAGEFQRLPVPRPLASAQVEEIEKLEERWLIVRSDLAAAELVGARLVAGQRQEAVEPAKTLLTSKNAVHRRLGERILQGSYDRHLTVPTTKVSLETLVWNKIRQAKQRLDADPRNPIAWADLARRYTGLGQFAQADRALRIARTLAPDSRYLLRVSARFFLHVGDPQAADHLLRSSPRTMQDPWLLATLMSSATMAQGRVPGRRVAQRILDSDRFRTIETAELVSELGTLELSGGADKRARTLMLQSLEAPTDNSLAQALWVAPKLRSFDITVGDTNVAFPAEAKAWEASHNGDWDVAFDESAAWLADQPFDADAATHASYVAAVGLDRWEDSLRFCEIGRLANPGDATLANNRAYALIELGRLDEGALALSEAVATVTDRSDRVAIVATGGLLQFRRGDPDVGRRLYEQAIDLSRRLGDPHAEVMARAMLIREEADAGTADLKKALVALDKAAAGLKAAGIARCVDRAHAMATLAGADRS